MPARVRHNPPTYRIGNRDEEPDQVVVERCLSGHLEARHLTTAERRAVVTILAGQGLSDRQIARRTRWLGGDNSDAVAQFRRRHRIPAGVANPAAGAANRHAPWWRDPVTRLERVQELAAVKASDWEIGRVAGVSAKTVWAFRRRHDIPPGRGPGRPPRGSRR